MSYGIKRFEVEHCTVYNIEQCKTTLSVATSAFKPQPEISGS